VFQGAKDQEILNRKKTQREITFHSNRTALLPSTSAGLRTLHRSRPCGAERNKSEKLNTELLIKQ
jgi:hypothetical protein